MHANPALARLTDYCLQLHLVCRVVFYSLQYLVERANELVKVLVDDAARRSRLFNRAICTRYDNIVRHVTTQAENTRQLVELQDYIEKLHVGELLLLQVWSFTTYWFQSIN